MSVPGESLSGGVSLSGRDPIQGVSVKGKGGLCLGGVSVQRVSVQGDLPPVNRQIGFKNITFPHRRWRVVITSRFRKTNSFFARLIYFVYKADFPWSFILLNSDDDQFFMEIVGRT